LFGEDEKDAADLADLLRMGRLSDAPVLGLIQVIPPRA